MDQLIKVFKYEGGRDEEVLAIFEKTLLASPYAIDFDKEYWANFIDTVQRNPDVGIIILIEDNSNISGVLVGQIYLGHPLVKHSKFAMEMFWYVKPECRGKASFKMVDLYEKWAEEVGATHITLSCLENEHRDKLDRIYKLKGYTPLETQYIRSIK